LASSLPSILLLRQIIISGHAAAVESAVAQANRQGATTTFLNVSGPFHTSLLRDAGKQLHDALLEVPMATPQKPVVSNVTASYLTEDDDIRQLLDEHVYKPVRWEESVNTMLEDGVDTFVEIGPKHLLTSFNRATAEERGIEARCLNVEDTATLEVLLKEMETA
jgi:[acyl-carrier-protein] S-malonyltransferase